MVGIGLLIAFGIGIVVAIIAAGLAQVPTIGVDDAATLRTFGEQFASIFLPNIVQYLPFDAAQAVVAVADEGFGGGGGQLATRLEPNTALLVVIAWLAGSLLVASLFTERAEISG